jgi:hypothetical protein
LRRQRECSRSGNRRSRPVESPLPTASCPSWSGLAVQDRLRGCEDLFGCARSEPRPCGASIARIECWRLCRPFAPPPPTELVKYKSNAVDILIKYNTKTLAREDYAAIIVSRTTAVRLNRLNTVTECAFPDMDDDGKPPTASRLYLELTGLLIEREIAKFTSGEQTAHQSFTNVAQLVRNAREELAGPGRPREGAPSPCHTIRQAR